ncbi:hypothetical protein [uncultured Paraglaciecola sp.]|uniref:hypothetical protein n=1 Tax=uncultured Paraglaciecola sp. TaxID=1765024 RepID=UPI00261D3023|nr:hypothetical protein [uncultured Paraglaciecola sp.]
MKKLLIALRLYFVEAVNIVLRFLMLSALRASVFFKKRLTNNEARFSSIAKSHDQYLAAKKTAKE